MLLRFSPKGKGSLERGQERGLRTKERREILEPGREEGTGHLRQAYTTFAKTARDTVIHTSLREGEVGAGLGTFL